MLEELSWNLDARRKGEAADAPPDLQSSHLSWPLQERSETAATGLLRPERSPGFGAATGSRGQLEAPTPVPHSSPRPGTASPGQSVGWESNARGSTQSVRPDTGNVVKISFSKRFRIIRKNPKQAFKIIIAE